MYHNKVCDDSFQYFLHIGWLSLRSLLATNAIHNDGAWYECFIHKMHPSCNKIMGLKTGNKTEPLDQWSLLHSSCMRKMRSQTRRIRTRLPSRHRGIFRVPYHSRTDVCEPGWWHVCVSRAQSIDWETGIVWYKLSTYVWTGNVIDHLVSPNNLQLD